jgi:hypothetical protein
MEKLSNEELIRNCAILYHNAIEGGMDAKISYQLAKAELLNRLNAGDKAKQMCKEIVELYDKHFEE